jgi:hypothetical protein
VWEERGYEQAGGKEAESWKKSWKKSRKKALLRRLWCCACCDYAVHACCTCMLYLHAVLACCGYTHLRLVHFLKECVTRIVRQSTIVAVPYRVPHVRPMMPDEQQPSRVWPLRQL